MGISPNVLPQQPLLSILKHHQMELLGARGSLRTSASSICPRAICYERRAPWGVAAGEDGTSWDTIGGILIAWDNESMMFIVIIIIIIIYYYHSFF